MLATDSSISFCSIFASRRSSVVSSSEGKETRTEDDFLGGSEHVERKGNLVLVPLALEELDN